MSEGKEIKKLLIFRPGHLGDTVVALPAIWSLRDAFPEAKITLLANIDTRDEHKLAPKDVLRKTGLIDEWIDYPHYENENRFSKSLTYLRLFGRLRFER